VACLLVLACAPGQPAASPPAKATLLSFGSHDEVVANAMKEGKLRVLTGVSAGTRRGLTDGFKQKYPSLELDVQVIEGTDAYQRYLLELQSGATVAWDVTYVPADQYASFSPYLKEVDILGMAEKGVLGITREMIDPVNRNAVGTSSTIQVVAYNPRVIAPERVPGTWEGILAPEFAGRKFVADIRGLQLAGLIPAWGLDKALDYNRKLAAQQPIWIRGATRAMTSLSAGEFGMFVGPNYNTAARAQQQDKTGGTAFKVIEPVPVRGFIQADGVLRTATNVNAGLLWLEYLASAEGQAIMDREGPFEASVFTPGSTLEQAIRGKQVSLVDWAHFARLEGYAGKIVEAYGFPKAEIE
jgi:ABC-type Fe3+ transport system substrate-binding protein